MPCRFFRGDRCAAGGIVWRRSSARLSSAHVRLPSHGLRAADKRGHSAEPFTEVTFVWPGPETDLQRTEGPTKQSGALTVGTKYREERQDGGKRQTEKQFSVQLGNTEVCLCVAAGTRTVSN